MSTKIVDRHHLATLLRTSGMTPAMLARETGVHPVSAAEWLRKGVVCSCGAATMCHDGVCRECKKRYCPGCGYRIGPTTKQCRRCASGLVGDGYRCSTCEKVKHAAEFGYRRQGKIRRARSSCLSCEVAASKQAGRDHPEKRAARNAVQRAYRTGKLAKGPCVHAGDGVCSGRVEAHHRSYEREHWLDVTYVCQGHFARLHARNLV